MRSLTSKPRILDDLADHAGIEEATGRMYALVKIANGLAQLDTGQSLDHEEVERRLGS